MESFYLKFSLDDFEDEFAQLQGTKPFDTEHPLDWSVRNWKEVMHRDLFVMMMVGQKHNGIIWGGFSMGILTNMKTRMVIL